MSDLGPGQLKLKVWRRDFWLKHAEGLAQVHAAIERVLARGRGWQVTEGNLPPPSSR